jgi:mannan endo-1,4-beta-mannosidase
MRSARKRRTVLGILVVVLVLLGATVLFATRSDQATPRPSAGTPATTGPSAPSPSPSSVPGGTGGVALGVYVKPDPSVGNAATTLSRFESTIDRHLAIVQTFTGWQDRAGAMIPFPTAFASAATSLGAVPMITWQPEQAVDAAQAGGRLSDQPDFSLSQLASGRYDGYIRAWAGEARAFGKPVDVRLMHEMNDKSYPWSIGVNGNTGAQEYVTAWRHIVDIFRSADADNVAFVWCVGAQPAQPDPSRYFPGDGYVSWIALDGYNRGSPWKSFTTIFATAYREITAASTRPVMIAETGTVERPGDPSAKAAWITSAFEREIPGAFPRIRAVLYFDAPGRGFSFALSSSGAALQAFRQVAQASGLQAAAPA